MLVKDEGFWFIYVEKGKNVYLRGKSGMFGVATELATTFRGFNYYCLFWGGSFAFVHFTANKDFILLSPCQAFVSAEDL